MCYDDNYKKTLENVIYNDRKEINNCFRTEVGKGEGDYKET